MNANQSAQWIIDNAGLTYQQMLNLTPQQVRDAFPNKSFSGTFLKKIILYVQRHANELRDEASMQALKGKVTTWLSDNFPEYEVERGRESKKPFIKIWLEGK